MILLTSSVVVTHVKIRGRMITKHSKEFVFKKIKIFHFITNKSLTINKKSCLTDKNVIKHSKGYLLMDLKHFSRVQISN